MKRTPVLALDAFPAYQLQEVTVAGRQVLLYRTEETVYAAQATCPHRAAPLAQGTCMGAVVVCPWHGARFDLRTGSRIGAPVCESLVTYESHVEGGQVYVVLP